MGFFDDFVAGAKKSFDDESKKSAERREFSSYRTLEEEQSGRFKKWNSQSDGVLLSKMNSSFTSDEDQAVIHQILLSRGYTKVGNSYRRR